MLHGLSVRTKAGNLDTVLGRKQVQEANSKCWASSQAIVIRCDDKQCITDHCARLYVQDHLKHEICSLEVNGAGCTAVWLQTHDLEVHQV